METRVIEIISKKTAEKMLLESLFKLGGTLTRVKYCGGKYKPESFPVGRKIEVSPDVVAVWAERRKDSFGSYIYLYCLK